MGQPFPVVAFASLKYSASCLCISCFETFFSKSLYLVQLIWDVYILPNSDDPGR